MRNGLDDHASGAPLHERVRERLAALIVLGDWPPGFVAPPEAALAREHGVSVGTMRRALADLAKEGLLTRRPRTGTVVTGRSPLHTVRRVYEFFRLHDLDGRLITSRAETLSVARGGCSADEAALLRIGRRAPVIRILRRRLVRDAPVMVDRIVLPEARAPGLADPPEKLYERLLQDYGLRIAAVRETLRAELATSDDRELLDLAPAPAPVLVIDAVAFDPGNAPILHAVHRAATTAHRYVNELR